MKRAFAKVGSARFLFDPEEPTEIHAEEECLQPHHERSYWHSAGAVPMADARKAVRFGVQLQWRAPSRACPFERHSVRLTAQEVELILVALDQGLEAGLPARCAIDVKARAA